MLRDAIGAARTAPWILYEAEAGKLGPMATVEDRAALAAAVERNILDRMRNRHLRSEYAKEFWRRQNHRPSRNGAARGGKGGSPPLPRSLAEPALLAALLYHPPLFHEFIEDIGMLEFSSREIRDARDIVISGLSAATDDGDLLDRAGNLIDGCPAVQEMVLTDAVFVAAPFVLPGIADDVVRSCIQDVLLNMQISSTQQEVDLLMGMLDGSETDRQVVDKITVLLSSLRV
jgi:hypothetical protein